MARKNIILCGFMGCGKTTVGQELAYRLFYDYVDLDEAIQETAGMTIPEIFSQKGEAAFRQIESRVLAQLCQGHGQVIAAGGGALLREENVKAARESGHVVFLNTDFEICYERIKDSDRPLVQKRAREELEALYNQRFPLYRAACEFEVFNNHAPKDCAKAIITTLL